MRGRKREEGKNAKCEKTIVRRRDETQTSPRRRFRASSTSTSTSISTSTSRRRYLRFCHHRRRCRSSYRVAAPSCRQGREHEDSASLMTQVSWSNFFFYNQIKARVEKASVSWIYVSVFPLEVTNLRRYGGRPRPAIPKETASRRRTMLFVCLSEDKGEAVCLIAIRLR